MVIFLLKFDFVIVEQSVQNFLCRLFLQWIHSLTEHTILRSKVQWATLCSMAVCFAPLFPQSFSLRSALKNTLEKTFSTCIRLHFSASFILFSSPFLFLRVHERQIISLSYMDISKPFVGVFHKNFTKKIAENFSRQPHIKRKSDIIQTSFSFFIKLFFIVLKALLRSLPFFCRLTTVS